MESEASSCNGTIQSDSSQPVIVFPAGQGSYKKPLIKFSVDSDFLINFPLLSTCPRLHNLTVKFTNETKVLQSLLFAHGFTQVKESDDHYNILWMWSHPSTYQVRYLKEYQRINHFLRSTELTRKDRLCANIQRMQQSKGLKHFNIIPKTFILPADLTHFQVTFRKETGVWIVKPCCLSRGRGIYLINHPSQLPLQEPVIVSQYIDNPLCIDGFKFDLRLYVAVTSFDPLRIYLYKEGLGRFASEPYVKDGGSLDNLCVHLTNYKINKLNPNFVRCNDPDVEDFGNKWSMSAVLRYLKEMGHDVEKLIMSIEDIVIKTIISGELPIAASSRAFQAYNDNCFELYGFDILIDDSLKPWVLEVNLSPSLECDSPLDLKIKSNLVADLLSLVGIPLQDPHTGQIVNKGTKVHKRSSSCRPKQFASIPLRSAKPVMSQETLVLTQTKEEYKRRGNFVRLFPSEDSWELYGAFLENKTRLNYFVHCGLYPHLCKSTWPPHSVTPIGTVIAQRLQTTRDEWTSVIDNKKELSAVQRVAVYLQQLPKHSNTATLVDNTAVMICPVISHLTSLQNYTLSKCQLRMILAAYLEKVHQRLMTTSEEQLFLHTTKEAEKFEMNLDTIGQFISRTSDSLVSPLCIIIPDRSLPPRSRCRMLAKQLLELIVAYKAETIVLQSKCEEEGKSNNEHSSQAAKTVTDDFVRDALSKASERDLEHILAKTASKTDRSLLLNLSEDVIVTSQLSSTLPPQNTSDNPKNTAVSQLCEHSIGQTGIYDICARTSNLTVKSLETDSVPVVNNTNAKTILKRSHSFTSSSLVGHRTMSRRFEIEEEEMDLVCQKPVSTSFSSTECKLAHSIKKDICRSSLLNCPVKSKLHTSSETCAPSEKVRDDSLSLREFRNETRPDQVTAEIGLPNPNEDTTVKRKQITDNMTKATTCKQVSTQIPRILRKHAHGEAVAHYLMKQKYPQTKKLNPITTRVTKRPSVSNSKTKVSIFS